MIFSLILCLIFAVLSSFHMYWFLGGTWGLDKAIPTQSATAPSIEIPRLATLLVALVLMAFGGLYLAKAGFIVLPLPHTLLLYAYWFIPSIFILRAIGEFNYVGFFKTIRDTAFAQADSKLFSPLCLSIGVMGLLVQLMGV